MDDGTMVCVVVLHMDLRVLSQTRYDIRYPQRGKKNLLQQHMHWENSEMIVRGIIAQYIMLMLQCTPQRIHCTLMWSMHWVCSFARFQESMKRWDHMVRNDILPMGCDVISSVDDRNILSWEFLVVREWSDRSHILRRSLMSTPKSLRKLSCVVSIQSPKKPSHNFSKKSHISLLVSVCWCSRSRKRLYKSHSFPIYVTCLSIHYFPRIVLFSMVIVCRLSHRAMHILPKDYRWKKRWPVLGWCAIILHTMRSCR